MPTVVWSFEGDTKDLEAALSQVQGSVNDTSKGLQETGKEERRREARSDHHCGVVRLHAAPIDLRAPKLEAIPAPTSRQVASSAQYLPCPFRSDP